MLEKANRNGTLVVRGWRIDGASGKYNLSQTVESPANISKAKRNNSAEYC